MSIYRAFHRRLGFMLGVSAVLATSVGLNVGVFAIVNALWLRPVPVKDAERVVALMGPTHGEFVSPYFATFERVAGQVATHLGLEPELRFVNVPRELEVMGVTSGYFRLFGLDIRGRDFTDDDDREGAELVAIISERLWSHAFGRRANILGATVAAHPVPVRIIGVAPPGFEGARHGERADVWIPRAVFPRVMRVQPGRFSAEEDEALAAMGVFRRGTPGRGTPLLAASVWARLAAGDTVGAADRRVKEVNPSTTVVPLSDVYGTPSSRTTLVGHHGAAQVVAGLALLVLFGGCAALASLFLVHYERRRLEFGIRSALGASPTRLVRFVGGELGAIGLAGLIGAVVVASFSLRGLPLLQLNLSAGVDLARLNLSFDWRVLAVGLSMTTITVTLAACLPLVRLTRPRLAGEVLGGPATTASAASQRVRQGLLALLVCATVVVLVSAALFVRSVDRAFGSPPGFDVDRTLFASVPLTPPVTFRSYNFQGARARLVWEALQGIPGVEHVAYGAPPISEGRVNEVRNLPTVSVSTSGGSQQLRRGHMRGSHNLLATLGIPVVAGRGLTPADLDVQPGPIVVTESMARMLWPSENPLGQRFGNNSVVVGIARDFAYGSLADPADGVFVSPFEDQGSTAQFVLRADRWDAALIAGVRRVLSEVLKDTPTATVLTGRDLLERDLGRQRLGAWFFSAFGLVALGVGAGSVFGMVAYLAESRRREFGVRLALGATPRDLVWYGVATALVPVAVGLASGLAVAAGVSQAFGSLLVGVDPVDGLTYGTVAVVLLCAAGGAALVGAWRLRRVAPAEALRTY